MSLLSPCIPLQMDANFATLAAVPPGRFMCLAVDPAIGTERMKSLGICVGRPLELLSTGDPMILRVCGSSIGLSRRLAAAVRVAPLSEPAAIAAVPPPFAATANG